MKLKNRIVMSPAATNLASPEGEATPSYINYLAARARGGVGLIITEDTTIGPRYLWRQLSLQEDRFVPGWSRVAQAVHASGAKIAVQLIHPSFNARFSLNGVQPVAASPIASRVYKEIPRELTVAEIDEIVKQFGEAARRAKEAGCDAVQIHCAHCHHLLGSFLSTLHNKRTDGYGGGVEGRMRLTLEVIRQVRSRVGEGFPILIRISGVELEPGGRTMEETQYMAPLMVEAGVNGFLVSAGTINSPWTTAPPIGTPLACNAAFTREIKKVVDVPVICVGRITNPWIAENVLASGAADMVAMARTLLADPEFPNKAQNGNWEDIVPCVGDLSCLASVGSDKKICCLANPAIGQEEEMALTPADNLKNVLVVGGGPAGLEAARIARLRGHNVTLMEKSSRLGGQLLMGAVPPMKQELTHIVQYLATQADKAGIEIVLNQEVTPEVVKQHHPDAVIIATGGSPLIPKGISGTDGKNVVTAWDVLRGLVTVGPRVLVVGGGKVGCETANFIANPVDDLKPGGNQVTILEMTDHVAQDERSSYRSLLVLALQAKGIRIITKARVVEILNDGVKYIREGKEETLRGMDSIVLAMGTKSENVFNGKIEDPSISVFVIGDAREPHTAVEAIAEGSKVAREI